MNIIYECAAKFIALENCEYRFVVSQKRKSREIFLNFRDSDFFHLAGLHYLTDINIPQNRQTTLKNIIEKGIITDNLLHKSRFYQSSNPHRDIKSRIEELRFLEEYLDTDNLIRIYNTKNDKYLQSHIRADYLIESQFKGSKDTVYIFLKKRNATSNYFCIVSFFKKGTVTYGGDKLYWMLKEKIKSTGSVILYRHNTYIDS